MPHLDEDLNSNSKRKQKSAFQFLLQSAEQTLDTESLFSLAWCYLHGLGTKRNDAEAVRVLRLADSPELEYLLGWCYLHGRGVETDIGEANSLFQSSAEMGCSAAEYEWGYSLYQGRGVQENREEALKWLNRAAKNDHPWDAETEFSWRFSLFAICCAFCYWLAIPFFGGCFAVGVAQNLVKGNFSAENFRMAVSATFLLAGPITFWIGIIASLKLARWGCVLMSIAGLELTRFAMESGFPLTSLPPLLGLWVAAIKVCINTGKRTYWFELKRNDREISFLQPIVICSGIYIAAVMFLWFL